MQYSAKSPPTGWDFDTIALISKSLDTVGIPSVLWGNRLISLYGVPTIVDGLSFVVPDEQLSKAVSTLMSVGFKSCDDPSCIAIAPKRVSPGPPAHLHLAGETDLLELHKHSDTLSKVDSLDPTEVGSDCDIMYASDPALPPSDIGAGCGPMPTDLYPVRIPSVHRYTEAAILLRLKYRHETQGPFWSAMISYIGQYVDKDGRLNHNLLPSSMQRFLVDRKGGKVKMKSQLNNLEKDLEDERVVNAIG